MNDIGNESAETATLICFVALSFASVSVAGAREAVDCAKAEAEKPAAASAAEASSAARRRFTWVDLCEWVEAPAAPWGHGFYRGCPACAKRIRAAGSDGLRMLN